MKGEPAVVRCPWPTSDLMIQYHDEEWGLPLHDDRRLFEAIVLDGAQAGLSWATILQRRKGYRRAFRGFDPAVVAAMTDEELERLLQDPGIIRNRKKVWSARQNAQAFLQVAEEFGSFDAYAWRFVDGTPIVNTWRTAAEVPATSVESDRFARDLKLRGFSFMGSTICYAFMQAVGMVNDHLVDCFRHREVQEGS